MSARKEAVAPTDRTVVNVTHLGELLWWSAEFRASPEQLEEAVDRVGPSPEEIRRHLREAAKESFKGGGED